MGNLVWDGFVGARDQVMLRHCMSTLFRVLSRLWLVLLQRYCTKDAKDYGCKGRTTYRTVTVPATEQAVNLDSGAAAGKAPQGSSQASKIRYQNASTLCN